MNRFVWVDCAKAIGIILVVYGHCSRGLMSAGLMPRSNWILELDSVIYSFHMPLFFFLAGIFFESSLQRKSLSQFLISKLSSVAYPYVLWSLIQGSIMVLLARHTNNPVSVERVLSFGWAPFAQFWFLYVLFFCFLFFALIFHVQSILFSYLLFPFLFLIYIFQNILVSRDSVFFLFLGNFIFFYLGMLFKNIEHVFREKYRLFFPSSLIFFVYGQWYFHIKLQMRYDSYGIESFLLAIFSIFFIIIISIFLSERKYQYLRLIGVCSMAIYLMHILAASGVRIILNRLGVESISIQLVFGMIVGLIGPIAVQRLIFKFGWDWLLFWPLRNAPISR